LKKKKAEHDEVVAEDIVVEEENTAPAPGEMFEVKGETASSSNIPAGLEKIVDKFPGKITKKK